MFVVFPCFGECYVLVHVCCVSMFRGMSCSGSCLMCFHVSQECGVLVHVWRKAALLCLQNLLSPCGEPQPKAWRGGGSWTGEQLSVETSGALFWVQFRMMFTHSGKPRCTPPQSLHLMEMVNLSVAQLWWHDTYYASVSCHTAWHLLCISVMPHILPSTGHENSIAQPEMDKWFSSPFHFSSFFIFFTI